MKLIGSWKHKYIGLDIKKTSYYVHWTDADLRHWGLIEEWYDGPLYRFGLWFIDFHWYWT